MELPVMYIEEWFLYVIRRYVYMDVMNTFFHWLNYEKKFFRMCLGWKGVKQLCEKKNIMVDLVVTKTAKKCGIVLLKVHLSKTLTRNAELV